MGRGLGKGDSPNLDRPDGNFKSSGCPTSVERARRAGATEAQLAERVAQGERFKTMYRNSFVRVALTLLEPLPVGLVFTLVAEGVLSRKRRTEDAAVA